MSNLETSRAERLDQYVASKLAVSRAFASRLITDGEVLVNGVAIVKPGYKLKLSDNVVVTYDQEGKLTVPDIDIPVIYEDKDCVVINKPMGILTHSKGAFNNEATVATWLRSRLDGMQGERAGIVHRLDRATSGVMICAKNPKAMAWLQKQFSSRKVKKTYIAVISGTLNPPQAVIDMPIERNPKRPQTFRVGSNGKAAITNYRVLSSADGKSLVELSPETGRTHQLRVHLTHQGHPIFGDVLYGGKAADRLYLHALNLEITLPDHTRQIFTAPLPAEFNEVVER